MRNDSYDCVVIGAGPGGSTTAALVAAQGHRVALVEREKFPLAKMGESLMPESSPIFEKLGIIDQLQKAGFVRRNGIQFVDADGQESNPIIFGDYEDRPSTESWHVERGRLDQLLFETAQKAGASGMEQTRVLDVQFNKNGQHSVTVRGTDNKERILKARVVVDASGQQALLANRLGLRVTHPDLKKAAIRGHYRGGLRSGGSNPEVTCILSTSSRDAWFCYIPFADDLVSVGLVGDSDFLLKRSGTPADTFAAELARCPGLQKRLRDARFEGRHHVAKDFSYSTSQRAGDGWVLAGDAFGFVDPLFGSGVYLALKSADLAASAICDGLRRNDLSEELLGRWTWEFDEGVQWLRKLVQAFDHRNFSMTALIKDYPQLMPRLSQVFAGHLFDGNPGALFDELDPWLAGMETCETTSR